MRLRRAAEPKGRTTKKRGILRTRAAAWGERWGGRAAAVRDRARTRAVIMTERARGRWGPRAAAVRTRTGKWGRVALLSAFFMYKTGMGDVAASIQEHRGLRPTRRGPAIERIVSGGGGGGMPLRTRAGRKIYIKENYTIYSAFHLDK